MNIFLRSFYIVGFEIKRNITISRNRIFKEFSHAFFRKYDFLL